MPTVRTRNIPRAGSQGGAATASNNSARSQTRSQKENNIREADKENAGRPASRTIRSYAQTGARTGLLGAAALNVAVLGATTSTKAKGGNVVSKTKTATKGKGLPPASVKRKKMPLQDITADFLPAPEAANRGEDAPAATEDVDNDNQTSSQANTTINVVTTIMPPPEVVVPSTPKFAVTSPLPPSSPPSDNEFTLSPSLQRSSRKLFDSSFRFFSSTHTICQEPYDPWQEFDDARRPSENNDSATKVTTSSSDPFGFISLGKKLQTQRDAVAVPNSGQDHEDEEDALLLVADTSSPRPVRRLKRSLQCYEAEVPESATKEEHDQLQRTTPSTFHQEKDEQSQSQKRRRMSGESNDIFGSRSPSPSPSKPSVRARERPQHQPVSSNDSDAHDELTQEEHDQN